MSVSIYTLCVDGDMENSQRNKNVFKALLKEWSESLGRWLKALGSATASDQAPLYFIQTDRLISGKHVQHLRFFTIVNDLTCV